MTIGNIKGYSVVDEVFIEELNSTGYYLKHDKTKAEVLYLKNKDEIMTFGIGFRTPPENSTGVAHIVEHCVLSGSRKYKTKEPFMDMLNSSMQTFLNAMTFPDKTIYPVATRNDKDFFNLMDVYLDAVFYPSIYDVKEIFEQEGWHLELEGSEDELKYNGVVYNEMRGAYSDADGQVHELLSQKLHPDSTYSHDSGGDPHEITNLTYEDFLKFHERFYHPSNSYIFLNGNMDIEKVLNFINEEYLENFEYQDPNSQIIMNENFKEPQLIEETYSVGKEDSTENKSYYAYGVDLGLSINPKDSFMRSILSDIIIDSDSSVLKDKLLDSNLAEDYYSMNSSSLPLDFFIVAKGASGDDLEEFVNIVEGGLREALKKGIDKDLIEATLNSYEFSLKELGIHKGVMLGIGALRGWLYGNSPLDSLKFKNLLDEIKENLDNRYIEDYIEKNILNNPQKIHLVARPEPGKFLEKDKVANEKLKEYKEGLKDIELEALIENTKNLFEYQLKQDSKEDKDTIPKLELEDISPGVKKLNTIIDENNSIKSIFVDEFTNKIFYMTLAFNLKNLTMEELPLAGVVLDLVSYLDTENYSYKDLSNKIDINTGGIKFSVNTFEDTKSDDYSVVASVSGRSIPDKIEEFLNLVEEIIFRTKFEDKKRIKDLLIVNRGDLESNIEQSGHSIISTEINSMMRDSSDIGNRIGGRKYLFSLKDLISRFDEDSDEIINSLKDVYKKIFNKKVILSVAGEKDWFNKTKDWIESLDELSDFEEKLEFSRDNIKSIALKSSSNVVYVSDGFSYQDYGYENNGELRVLAKILSGDYLHTQIRAKGGAYGAGISINQKGNVTTYSYRDPNLDKTFQVYDNISQYLDNLDLSKEDLTNYIISTMNQFDPPMTPSQYPSLALSRYLTNFSEEDVEKMKKEAIETTPEDIKKYSEMFKKAKDNKYYGVLGSRELIENSTREFEKVEEMNI